MIDYLSGFNAPHPLTMPAGVPGAQQPPTAPGPLLPPAMAGAGAPPPMPGPSAPPGLTAPSGPIAPGMFPAMPLDPASVQYDTVTQDDGSVLLKMKDTGRVVQIIPAPKLKETKPPGGAR